MTTYSSSIPKPGDFLSKSQQDLLNNFSSANTSFLVDHYTFSDETANNGKHNKVTTPIIIGTATPTTPPTTALNEPIFYALAPYPTSATPTWENFTLQYSRGGNDAVPTPLTTLQSPAGGITINFGDTSDILDFNGITLAYFNVFSVATFGLTQIINATYGYWNGTTFQLVTYVGGSPEALNVVSSTTKLQLKNTSSSVNATGVYWTLQFLRIV